MKYKFVDQNDVVTVASYAPNLVQSLSPCHSGCERGGQNRN